jgi:PEP-CTERM motif
MNLKQTLAVAALTLAAAGTAFAGDTHNQRGQLTLTEDAGHLTGSVNIKPLADGTFDDYFYFLTGDMRSVSTDITNNKDLAHNKDITWLNSSLSDGETIHSFTGTGTTQHSEISGGNSSYFLLHLQGHVDTGHTGDYSVQVTAVPEPETVAMLLAGLGVVGWASRRRAARLTLPA